MLSKRGLNNVTLKGLITIRLLFKGILQFNYVCGLFLKSIYLSYNLKCHPSSYGRFVKLLLNFMVIVFVLIIMFNNKIIN